MLLSQSNLLGSLQTQNLQASQNLLSSQGQYQSTPSRTARGDEGLSVNQSPVQNVASFGTYGNQAGNQAQNYGTQSISSSGSFNQFGSRVGISYGLGNSMGINVPVTSSIGGSSLSGSLRPETWGAQGGNVSSGAGSGVSSSGTASFGKASGTGQEFPSSSGSEREREEA